MITVEQESLRAAAELAGHCDHQQEEIGRARQRKLPFFLLK